jgi:hypothetical protein
MTPEHPRRAGNILASLRLQQAWDYGAVMDQSSGSDVRAHARALWVPGAVNEPLQPRLHAVHLSTHRLAEMVDWYGSVLGTDVLELREAGAVLALGPADQLLCLEAAPEAAATAAPWRFSVAFDWLDELVETYLRLLAEDIVPSGVSRDDAHVELRYRDPDGNVVALTNAHDGDCSLLVDDQGELVDADVLAAMQRGDSAQSS